MLLVGLILFAGCCSTAVGQQTWLVDWYGNGDFTDMPPAVAAASPGDTIVVANSDLNLYTPTLIDKGITLRQSYNYFTVFDVQVANLPAGQRFALVGWGGVFNLNFTNCAGQVVLDRVDMFRAFDGTRRSCMATNCDHITVNASGLLDVFTSGSRAVFSRSGMFGYRSLDGTIASPGLTTIDSDVSIADCFVQGESHLAQTTTPAPVAGIEMQGGSLVVTGRGGFAYVQGGSACCDVSVDPAVVVHAPAIRSDGGSCQIDPDVALAPVSGAPTVGTSVFDFEEIGFLRQVTLPYPAAGALETDLYAVPGVPAIVCASAPVAPLPTPFGELWVDPLQLIVVASGTTDATGRLYHVFGGLNASIPVDLAFAWQGVYLANGMIELTLPSTTVMWTH